MAKFPFLLNKNSKDIAPTNAAERGRETPGTAAEKQVQAELVLLELAEVPDTANPGFGCHCAACWMLPLHYGQLL